jgi:hypothetical protein
MQLAQVPAGGQTVSIALSPDARLAYTGIQEHDTIAAASVPDRKLVRTFKTAAGTAGRDYSALVTGPLAD